MCTCQPTCTARERHQQPDGLIALPNALIASVPYLTNMKVWVPALRLLPKGKFCAAPVICHVAAGVVMSSTNSSTKLHSDTAHSGEQTGTVTRLRGGTWNAAGVDAELRTDKAGHLEGNIWCAVGQRVQAC